MSDKPYAEQVNYWKTGASSPDTWIARAKAQIEDAGGEVLAEAFASGGGRAAFILRFRLQGDEFRVEWPVLESQGGDVTAARRQAATMLYHDVKARCVGAKVLGGRRAFLGFLVLPGGRTAGSLGREELSRALPAALGLPAALPAGREAHNG